MTKEQAAEALQSAISEFEAAQANLKMANERFILAARMRDQALRINAAVS